MINATIGRRSALFKPKNSAAVVGSTLASGEHHGEGHSTAWIEGVAILLCVIVVVLVRADISREP